MLNTDEWLQKKKGYNFLSYKEREIILTSNRFIDRVIKATDKDDTVVNNLKEFVNNDLEFAFANGGDRKSITGYGFELTPNGPLISWKSKKQQTVALSTCEAEYMSLASAAQEGKFLKSLITDMMGTDVNNFVLYCDNQGSLALAKNPVQHQRSKHIDIRYHFVREVVKSGSLDLYYVPTDENIADMFTKSINSTKFRKFRDLVMGM